MNDVDGFLRIVAIGVRKYSRDPASRAAAARLMLSGAIALLTAETSAAEASIIAIQLLADRIQAEQRTKNQTLRVVAESGERA